MRAARAGSNRMRTRAGGTPQPSRPWVALPRNANRSGAFRVAYRNKCARRVREARDRADEVPDCRGSTMVVEPASTTLRPGTLTATAAAGRPARTFALSVVPATANHRQRPTTRTGPA